MTTATADKPRVARKPALRPVVEAVKDPVTVKAPVLTPIQQYEAAIAAHPEWSKATIETARGRDFMGYIKDKRYAVEFLINHLNTQDKSTKLQEERAKKAAEDAKNFKPSQEDINKFMEALNMVSKVANGEYTRLAQCCGTVGQADSKNVRGNGDNFIQFKFLASEKSRLGTVPDNHTDTLVIKDEDGSSLFISWEDK